MGRFIKLLHDSVTPSEYASIENRVSNATDHTFQLENSARNFFTTIEQFLYEHREGRDIGPHIQKTLGYCRQLIAEDSRRAKYLKVRGYAGHLYFTGAFVDRNIMQSENKSHKGIVGVQIKANFKSQHEGIVLTFRPGSRYSTYYTDSCCEIWNRSSDLLNDV